MADADYFVFHSPYNKVTYLTENINSFYLNLCKLLIFNFCLNLCSLYRRALLAWCSAMLLEMPGDDQIYIAKLQTTIINNFQHYLHSYSFVKQTISCHFQLSWWIRQREASTVHVSRRWRELPKPWSWKGVLLSIGIISFNHVYNSNESIINTILCLQASQQVAKPDYDKKVQPGTLIPKQLGNMYTASIYAAFASLIHNKSSSLVRLTACLY